MSTPHRFPLFAAGIFGAMAVGLGAFGAHALQAKLTELGTRELWKTAVTYHLVHTVALLGIAAWLRAGAVTSVSATKRLTWAARCWSTGIVLFSGGLYFMSLTANAPVFVKAAVPPVGGSLFIVGWLCVVATALAKED
jgi:uncharacterized membrane protein YgdD (TMEM256/DUF423 family)